MNVEVAVFLAVFAALCAAVVTLGIRVLPRERFQVVAALPVRKDAEGKWTGLNMTWYGLISGVSYAAASALALVLLGSIGVDLIATGTVLAILIVIAVPASRWVAQIVEGKQETFSVGAAVFVGGLAVPGVIALVNQLQLFANPLPILPTLAALAAGYTLGEGWGRLACISFGCCFGKPVADVRGFGRLFSRWPMVFEGKTRKISFAAGLDGVEVVPIQAVTAILYSSTAVLSAGLFLSGHMGATLILATCVTQLWRAFSEFLRADYRGEQKISAYQIMAVVLVVYFGVLWAVLPSSAVAEPRVMAGLQTVWQPLPILALQLLIVAVFVYMGASRQTGSQLRFHVHRERI